MWSHFFKKSVYNMVFRSKKKYLCAYFLDVCMSAAFSPFKFFFKFLLSFLFFPLFFKPESLCTLYIYLKRVSFLF